MGNIGISAEVIGVMFLVGWGIEVDVELDRCI